jgi:hypothetical protein
VLRDRGLGERKNLDDLAADAGAARGQNFKDSEPCRMGERLQLLGKGLVLGIVARGHRESFNRRSTIYDDITLVYTLAC